MPWAPYAGVVRRLRRGYSAGVRRLRPLFVVLLVLAVAGTCVRLGIWQLGRWREKEAANARLRTALVAPPRPLAAGPAGLEMRGMREGRVRVAGRFDETHQFVLVGRTRSGEPGVHLVTPLLPDEGGPAVLVDRGFVPSPDAATISLPAFHEPGARTVVGLVEPLVQRDGDPVWKTVANDSLSLWTARWLDPDSVAAALPYAVAGVVVRELPGPGVPARPARKPARLDDTSIHLSYAGQWFFFALVALIGPLVLRHARRRRREEFPGGSP